MADPIDPHSIPTGTVSGLRLKDRYRIEKELGRGGIGVVYLARDEQLHGRPVVIKVLLDRSAESEWFQKKFRQEIEALVRIDHPGVVGALDAGEMPDGKPFFVMQFVQGANLRSLMKEGAMGLPEVASIVRQVGTALTAAHEKGVYHRDLKPENIMLQDLGHGERLAKIIDFGIATVHDPADQGSQHTQIAGSVLYMAPEQLMGKPEAASDIYALGVIAYELLLGEPPFRPSSPFELPALHQQGVKVKPTDRRPDLPPDVDTVVLRALALHPKDRPASAREFGDELTRVLMGTATIPSPMRAGMEATFRVPTQISSGAVAAGSGAMRGPSGAVPLPPTVLTGSPGVPISQAASGGMAPTPGYVPTYPPASTGARPQYGSAVPAAQAYDTGPTTRVPTQVPTGGAYPPPASQTLEQPPRGEVARPRSPVPKSGPPVMLWVGLGALLVIGGITTVVILGRKPVKDNAEAGSTTVTGPARELAYSLTVQKYRDGQPYREPFQLAQEMLFGPDDRLRLTFTSPQTGHLYIVNEGPDPKSGKLTYNVQFPTPSTPARLSANQEVRIPPEPHWIKFDEAQGTEKLWLVFSPNEVPELEAVKGLANPQDKGVVSDPGQADALRALFTKHQATPPQAVKDEAQKRTLLKASGDILVGLVKLEHQ